MSRKDYRAVAAALRAEWQAATYRYPNDPVRADTHRDAVRKVASELCPVFRADNSNFDTARFMEAAIGD